MPQVNSALPTAKPGVSVVNDGPESVFVSIEVLIPGAVPGVEFVFHSLTHFISLVFQMVDDSRDVSDNLVLSKN